MMTYDVDSYFYFIENNLAIYIIKINNTRLLKFWSLYFIRNIIDFFYLNNMDNLITLSRRNSPLWKFWWLPQLLTIFIRNLIPLVKFGNLAYSYFYFIQIMWVN